MPASSGTLQEVAPARPRRGLGGARLLPGRRGPAGAGARAPGTDLMAARAPEGPGDTASAALDELSRNFTYGALGVGNGSLSGAWYRRNQVRAAAPPPGGGHGGPAAPPAPRPPPCPLPGWELLTSLHTLT